jgi:hypothetical protein
MDSFISFHETFCVIILVSKGGSYARVARVGGGGPVSPSIYSGGALMLALSTNAGRNQP